MSLEAYFKQHEALVDQLRAYNKPVDEEDRFLSLLAGLPDRFVILRTFLMQKHDLTYRETLEALRSDEAT